MGLDIHRIACVGVEAEINRWKVRLMRFRPQVRRVRTAFQFLVAAMLLLTGGSRASAQSETPVISGAAGFLGAKDGRFTFFQPVIAPMLAAPIGDRWLVEARADLRGFVARADGTGPYEGRFFPTLEYAQVDFNAADWLTVVAGRFLTPFNIYNERFTPIWIGNFQDAPLIYPIGTRTTGYSDGLMARGLIFSRRSFQLNYTAYFSALSTITHLESGRAAGARTGVFFPKGRFELGVSYQRLLQDERMNSVGAYLSWQPNSVPLTVRSEYAHSPRGQGYWLEGAYRFSRYTGTDSILGRLQALARVQQFFRLEHGAGDFLPLTDTQRVDFGWNYYLPHEIRLNATYGRQFSPSGNLNVWDFGVTYRFLFPMYPGGHR
jgi:hypothetical protein